MTSVPSTLTALGQTQSRMQRGDAVVVRGIAAFLTLLALTALLVVERPAAYGVSASILALAVALFAAAAWRARTA